jgi:hypothetical protein
LFHPFIVKAFGWWNVIQWWRLIPQWRQFDLHHMHRYDKMKYKTPPLIARFKIPAKFRSEFRFRAKIRDFWSRSRRNHF